jgi:hypothetical protein
MLPVYKESRCAGCNIQISPFEEYHRNDQVCCICKNGVCGKRRECRLQVIPSQCRLNCIAGHDDVRPRVYESYGPCFCSEQVKKLRNECHQDHGHPLLGHPHFLCYNCMMGPTGPTLTDVVNFLVNTHCGGDRAKFMEICKKDLQ